MTLVDFLKNIYFILTVPGLSCTCGLIVAACMWDLVPQPGIKPGPPALGT